VKPHSVGRLVRVLFSLYLLSYLGRILIIVITTVVVWIMPYSYGRKEGSKVVGNIWNVRVLCRAACSVMSRGTYLRLDGSDKSAEEL
jgi:hypothetical protein